MAKSCRYQFSPWAIALLSAITVLVTSAAVLVFGPKALLINLTGTVGGLSVCLFFFISHFLYRGVGMKNLELVRGEVNKTKDLELVPIGSWIGFTCVIFVLQIFSASFQWGSTAVLAVCVFWAFYRALRLAFFKSPNCKGKIFLSFGFGLIYTVIYMGWTYAALLGSQVLFR